MMPPTLSLQPIPVRTGSQDREGQLVLVEGELVAILVRLADEAHGRERGQWFLEVGFGSLMGGKSRLFATLDEAQAWVRDRLTRPTSLV